MICTEQERAALMALVARFGNSMSGETREDPDDLYAAIRAMLAPDDAVVRERIAKAAFDVHSKSIDVSVTKQPWPPHRDWVVRYETETDYILAVLEMAGLRGEATRDE